MSKWEKVKLEDVCNILDAQRIPITASAREHGQYPYYGANGIQDYVSDYIFNGEFVLIAEDGGNFGSKTKPIAYRVSGKCWVNNHAHVLSAKSNINIDYLCYSLMFYDVSKIISGTTRAKLNQAALRKMEIPLPTLEKQHKIASILDTVSEALKLRKQQLNELDLLVKSKFIEMFGDPVENPYKWDIKYLGDICDVRDGTHDSPKYINEGYPLITSKNIINGEINFKNCNLISKEDFENINKRSKVNIGDIIMPMIGTIGNPIVVTSNIEFAIKNVALIKFNKGHCITNIYVKILLESNYLEKSIIKSKRGGTQKFIALGDIRKLYISVPPIELQNKFASFVEHVDKLKSEVQKSIEQLQTLFDSLMQEYFE